ncbi:type II secretion system minor pseudopilin GspI [Stutzerimonas azotifigens]|uniref:type II secretion system minor pseudopilin GspI n=1 Tax=Stutzerimonas azotifigens TaxID=291995 RepID=UPI0003F6659B|nr:type II secretion system minor pseudopilin GspI [Stutzerimonas azotifigens]
MRARGFTLLEVLIALAIFAVVSATVLTATGRSLNNAARLEEVTLAGWIADNRLTELQVAPGPPATGRQEQALEYAGRRWQLLTQVESTTDASLLRVTVWVAPQAAAGRGSVETRAATSLTGFVEVR